MATKERLVPATLEALKPRDRNAVVKAVFGVIGDKDDAKVLAARRWAAKALKMARGTRTTPMTPGEDGLPDEQRQQILEAINLAPAWIEANRTKLGFSRAKS